MSGRKVCCIITLIMLCLLILNVFLPIGNGENASIFGALTSVEYGESSFVIIFAVLISFFFLIFGIIDCILCLCNVRKDYKYTLAAIPIPMLLYFFILTLFFNVGGSSMSIGGILGPLLCIASIVLSFVGNAIGNKSNTNYYQNNTPNTQIKGYDPMTGKPIYATFNGYDPNTGAPIYR